MKALYLKALELLATVPAIKYADLDKGQLEGTPTRVPLQFPCALVKVELVNAQDIAGGQQKCQARLTLRIAFSYAGERTGSNATDDVRNESLNYFDVVDDVHQAFQGQYGDGLTRLSRLQAVEERRNDGLKVLGLPYSTTFVG